MGEARFYHLTRSTADRVAAALILRARGQGLRVALRGTDAAALDRLDARLWLEPEDGFLPHGRAGGPQDADQPVLLTEAAALPNGARCLILIDGATTAPAEAAAMERVCILFDGGDAAAVEAARAEWRALTRAGIRAQYWSEADGGWQMKAESG